MANTITRDGSAVGALGTNKPPLLKATPDAYVSLDDILDYNKPDNRDLLVNTFGDQGITGFLQLTGAIKNAGVNDEVQWWEEGRLHPHVAYSAWTGVASDGGATGTITLTQQSINDAATTSNVNSYQVRVHDVLLLHNGRRILILTVGTGSATFRTLDGGTMANASTLTENAAVIGNLYGQGSDQPTNFYQTDVTKRTNPYMIVKETYAVNGSQATNIGWVNLGNGDYRWYIKGEQDTRKRFMDKREMMLLFGEKNADSSMVIGSDNGITGSEGYFAAVEDRGLVADVSGGNQGTFAGLSDFDKIILELDKEGAPAEYAMYLNRKASLDIDDLLAQGIATQTTAGLAGQFGAFNNDADMAVKLGFKSFTRGGYTFHKHDWKLLNDPTTGGLSGYYKGAMVPMTKVTDARTGMKAPALEMNYKGTNGYNRDMEHWVMGSILGHTNMSKDVAEFYYRSECNLVTRAANQHVVIK